MVATIDPVRLPGPSWILNKSTAAYVIGWGQAQNEPTVLMKVSSIIWTNEKCNQKIQPTWNTIHISNNLLCVNPLTLNADFEV